MQSISSRIWTRVTVSIPYDDNHYTTGTSTIHLSCLYLVRFLPLSRSLPSTFSSPLTLLSLPLFSFFFFPTFASSTFLLILLSSPPSIHLLYPLTFLNSPSFNLFSFFFFYFLTPFPFPLFPLSFFLSFFLPTLSNLTVFFFLKF